MKISTATHTREHDSLIQKVGQHYDSNPHFPSGRFTTFSAFAGKHDLQEISSTYCRTLLLSFLQEVVIQIP